MVRKIISDEGIWAFYKGIIPSLILTLNPVIQFTSYELLRNSFSDSRGKISNSNIVLISFISKLVTILVNYPLMTIKSMFQANAETSPEKTLKILVNMINEEGFFSLYKGLSSKVVGSLMSNVILMLSYEQIQLIVRWILVKFLFKKVSFRMNK